MVKRDFYVFAGTICILLAGLWLVRINNPTYILEQEVARQQKEQKAKEKAEQQLRSNEITWTELKIYLAPVGDWTGPIDRPENNYFWLRSTGKKWKMRVPSRPKFIFEKNPFSPDDWEQVIDNGLPWPKFVWPAGDLYLTSLDPKPQLVLILQCSRNRCGAGIRHPDETLNAYRDYYQRNMRTQTVTAPVGAWSTIPVPILIDKSGFWVNWEHTGKIKMRITPTPNQPMSPHDFQTTLIPGKGENLKIEYTGNMYFMSLEKKPIEVIVRQCPQSVCPRLWAEWLRT
jgi:hypothetical protein